MCHFLVIFTACFVSKLQNVYVEMVVHCLCLSNIFMMHNSLHIEITGCSALCEELTCLAGHPQIQRWWTRHSVTLKGIVGVFEVFLNILTHLSLQKSQIAQYSLLTRHYFRMMYARTFKVSINSR